MTRALLIIACLIALFNDYFIHDWTQWLIISRFVGCIFIYVLCLNLKGWDLALSGTILLLAFFELLDELRGVHVQLAVTDAFIDLIAVLYLIREKWKLNNTTL